MIENIRVNVISNNITAIDKTKSIHRRKISKCVGNLNYIKRTYAEYRSFCDANLVQVICRVRRVCCSKQYFWNIRLTAYIMNCTNILY